MAKQLTLFTIYIPFQFMLMISHQQDMTLRGGWHTSAGGQYIHTHLHVHTLYTPGQFKRKSFISIATMATRVHIWQKHALAQQHTCTAAHRYMHSFH